MKQRSSFNSSRLGLFAGAALVSLLPAAAMAQAIPDPRTNDNDAELTDDEPDVSPPTDSATIIVTATKRAQTLQEAPVSVSVTTGETLERAEIRDLLDLQTVTPSLRVSQLQSSANTTFIIRGFGNGANNVGVEPSVAVFIDGVFRSRSAAQINDIANVERVEVLRGPQSTLFGKNASAGVINVVTREPQFDFGGSISATYGNYDQIVVKGDITGPLTQSVAFSLEGNYNKRDGYVDVVNLDEKINDRDRWMVRGQLLFDNGGPLRLRAIGDYSKIDELCCYAGNVRAGPTTPLLFALGGAIEPENLYSDRTYLNKLPVNKIEAYGGSLQGDLELGQLTLTSITSYRELRAFSDQDVDFTSVDFINEFRDQAVDTFTQEVRLASDFDGPLNFLLGGFYFKENVEQTSGITNGTQTRPFFDLLAGNGVPGTLATLEAQLGIPAGSIFAQGPSTREAFSLDDESYSIFGTVDFKPIDRLTITGGFNYTHDAKDFTAQQTSFDPLANINLADAFITAATGGAVRTRAQFQALPAAAQAQLGALALRPCGTNGAPPQSPACNPLLPLAALQFLPPFLAVPNAVEPGRTRDGDWSYTGRVAFDVSDQINTYFTYATGFKASSVNLSRDSRPVLGDYTPATLPSGVRPIVGGSNFLAPSSPILDAGLPITNLTAGTRFAGPEESEVYELGIKAAFPGLAVNLAIFDQTLKGFQSNAFTGTGFALVNAGKQSTKGFELDSTITPIDPLVFTFSLTYLDPKYDSFTGSAVGDLTGFRPADIPAWTIATSASYTHEFGNSGNLLIGRIDYYHESNTQIVDGLPDFADFSAPDPYAAARAIAANYRREINQVNASLTLVLENGFELTGYVRNLTNDRYTTQIFPSVAQQGSISGYPNAPRTYGVTGRFRF